MPTEYNVCSNSLGRVAGGSTITLKNENQNEVIISASGTKKWPFTTGPSLTVPAKAGSTPGTLDVTLINSPGTGYYNTSGCHPDILVNPKTVIIT